MAPNQIIPGICLLRLKHGRVSKKGLTLKPKKVPSMVIRMSQGHLKYVTSDRVMSPFHLGQSGYNFSPDNGKGVIFFRKHA